MSRVVVTGAGGYLGSRLVRVLPGAVAIARSPVEYLPVEQHQVDLSDPAVDLEALLAGAGAVVHLAGHNEVVASSDPDRALSETVLASRRVGAAARAAGVARIVYVSTVHVYGGAMDTGGVLDAASTVPAPKSVYAIARLTSEHVINASVGGGTDAVVLRLTNAVGSPAAPEVNRWTLVANDLCRQAVKDRALRLRSSGLQFRDFVPLADVCRIVAACADPAAVPGGTYDLGSGTPHTVLALAELVCQRFRVRTGVEPTLTTGPPEVPAPVPYRVAVDALARHGLRAQHDLTDAVDELIEFCIANEARL